MGFGGFFAQGGSHSLLNIAGLGCVRSDGKFNPKAASPTFFAFKANPTVHQLNQVLTDHQTYARAFNFAVGCTEAAEGTEQFLLSVFGDSVSCVVHDDADALVVHSFVANADFAPLMIVFDGVGNQIGQHLLEADVIDLDKGCVVAWVGDLNGDAAICSHAGHQGKAVREGFVQVDRLNRKLNLTRFDSGQIENIVDESQQVLPCFGDLVCAAFLFLAQGLFGVEIQNLGKAKNGIHRGSQLMAHGGQKSRFGLVCYFCCVDGFSQRLFVSCCNHRKIAQFHRDQSEQGQG